MEKFWKVVLNKNHLEHIVNAEHIAIFAHQNPDGDAYGSSLAMKRLLENMGKKVSVFLPDTSDVYHFLPWYEQIQTSFDYGEYDLLMIFDCSTFDRLGKIYFENPEYFSIYYYDTTLVIDHHIVWSTPFALKWENILQYHWYSSTCELVYDLFFEHLGEYFDAEVATCLLLGIYTDTGKFKYWENPEHSFRIASALMKLWADRDMIVSEYLQGRKLEEIKFAAYLIDRVQTIWNIMYTYYSEEDLEQFGIDTERATLGLNILQTVKSNGITVVVRYVDGVLKFSMRSRGDLNVWEIASKRGGGWHKNAAGFPLKVWNITNYEQKIHNVLEEMVRE